ncbi:hypothetical protein QAD02_011028 [Eretmocerus hayati]|uniref:Uncharacterized protein n=1 Tax=Eretmocerus hayati TaxID=131215 RepID=A0ACC2NVV9_9HYME|nr:hypothetical protein QAD02_011028 [Eretmocerus hayati]
MSIPRARTPSSDVASVRSGYEPSSADRPIRCMRKPSAAVGSISNTGTTGIARSRIPKQGAKGTPSRTRDSSATGGLQVPEKPSTATRPSSPQKDQKDVQDDQPPPPQQQQQPQLQQSQSQAQRRRPPTPSRQPMSKSQEQKPPVTSSLSSQSRTKSVVSTGYGNQKRVLENQFNTKKVRYITLRRDIDDKQKSSESAFEELRQLRERIVAQGGKDPGRLDEIIPIPSWSARVRLSLESGSAGNGRGGAGGDERGPLGELEDALRDLPEAGAALCREALEKRVQFLDWLTDNTIAPNEMFKEELEQKTKIFKEDNADFERRLSAMQQEERAKIDELLKKIHCLWQECQILRADCGRIVADPDNNLKIEELNRELKAEKERTAKARTKIRELEGSISGAETKLKQSQEHAKQLEAQLKQSAEHKAKELAKCQKSSEAALGKLEKQRESVETRINKLKADLQSKENELKSMSNEYRKQIDDLQREIESERSSRQDLEFEFEELKVRHKKLEDNCKELLDVNEKRKELPDDQHTEYEIQLFNDLKETQRVLAEKEEIIQKLQLEREDIIAAVNEADQENDTSKQRLSAELLKKSNELQTVRSQFNQLQKNYKRLQSKYDHLEHKLMDLGRCHAGMKDGSRASYEAQILQLQQQVTDLRSSLTETDARNAELEKSCTQLQLKLEHYKRYLRNHERDVKIRREMHQLLKHGKSSAGGGLMDDTADDHEQSNGYEPLETEGFQELYSALEDKELQVLKLEKLVKQMEKQEEYSQAQRTRLESRIAKLEVALKEGQQAHRNRGFSFL